MKPETARWHEDASYDYFDDLSVEGLAWECLRRNEAYQAHYQSLATIGAETEPLSRKAEQRWGLRFRGTAFGERFGADRALVGAGQPGRRAPRSIS